MQRPRTTHQNAIATGSLEPKGNGASADAANSSQEAIAAFRPSSTMRDSVRWRLLICHKIVVVCAPFDRTGSWLR